MPFGGMGRRTYKPGQILKFTYRWHTGATPEEIKDDFKEVLVLHGSWQGKMHAIDMKRLTDAERTVLQTIMDNESHGKPHPIPLINDILRRMDPVEEIKNPMAFYSKFVKVFLRNKDAYRTYFPRRMWAVTIVQKTDVKGTVINPKPLFRKIETPKKEPEPTKKPPEGRIDLIKKRADRLKMIKQRAQSMRPRVERPKVQRPKRPR